MPRNKNRRKRRYDEGSHHHARKRQKISTHNEQKQFQRRVTYTDQPDLQFLFPPSQNDIIDLTENEEEEEYEVPGVIFVTKLRARTRRKKLHTHIQKFAKHFHCFVTKDNTAEIVMQTRQKAEKFLQDLEREPFTQGQSDPAMMPKFTLIDYDEYKSKNFWLWVNPRCRATLWNFSEGVQQHFIASRPDDEETNLKGNIMELIRHRIKHTFPNKNPAIILFGSAMCGLDSAKSDLDVAVKIGSKDARKMSKSEEKRLLVRIKNSLAQHRWFVNGNPRPFRFKIIPILNAKVPILNVTDPMYGLNLDISLYREQTQVGLWISRLCEFDNRVRTFLIAVKYWSKQRGVNNAKCGYINSFGWVMLGLKFLQFISPPVIPIVGIEDFLNEQITTNFKQKNKMDQGTLLYGFFTFYSQFDFKKFEVMVREKELMVKRHQEWEKLGVKKEKRVVIIEDPFQLDNNVARNVKEDKLGHMLEEFNRGKQLCESFSAENFEELCEQYMK